MESGAGDSGAFENTRCRECPTSERRLQSQLDCCGYFSPFVEATNSALCYSRSNLPGCKQSYLHLERQVLEAWYIISFSLVLPHLTIVVLSLMCSNHITYRFGKGMTPKRYRLDLASLAVIMDEYAGWVVVFSAAPNGQMRTALTRSQIAEKYGAAVASDAVNYSSSNLEPSASAELNRISSRTDSFRQARSDSPPTGGHGIDVIAASSPRSPSMFRGESRQSPDLLGVPSPSPRGLAPPLPTDYPSRGSPKPITKSRLSYVSSHLGSDNGSTRSSAESSQARGRAPAFSPSLSNRSNPHEDEGPFSNQHSVVPSDRSNPAAAIRLVSPKANTAPAFSFPNFPGRTAAPPGSPSMRGSPQSGAVERFQDADAEERASEETANRWSHKRNSSYSVSGVGWAK